MDALHPLLQAAKIIETQRQIGFGGQSIIARNLGVSRAAVGQWKDRKIPAEFCPVIEEMTNGEMTCEDLRPDVRWDLVRKRRPPHPGRVARLAAVESEAPQEQIQDTAQHP